MSRPSDNNWAVNKETYEDLMTFLEYVDVARQKYGLDWTPTHADVHHSALIRRITEGKPLFKVPPPKSYSYPWYAIIDQGYWAFNAHTADFVIRGDVAYISQDVWKVVPGKRHTTLTYTGKDEWELLELLPSQKYDTGGRKRNPNTGVIEPIYATHKLERIDTEDIW